jgi:ABC-type Mn2+/Zn2+ transport system ATPase subunit
MFAFLKIIEKRNGVKTNLLILDEILDSSVDSEGREELLNILKEEFSQTKDIIIISHNQEIQEKIELFDRVIKISKDKFSSIEVEEID